MANLPPYSPRTIAQWYLTAPDGAEDTATLAAYAAFRAECRAQLQLIKAQGITVEWTDANPYANSAALFEDVNRGRLQVFRTSERPHAGLTRYDNNVFRAVHDYFGHYRGRYGFGPVGEYRAYLAHSRMFHGPALLALATETLGQNSVVNFGPFSHVPAAVRPYAPQRCILFPPSLLPKD